MVHKDMFNIAVISFYIMEWMGGTKSLKVYIFNQ